MIKILLGGSPCTFWSIAKSSGRETEAEGQGWELFKNYLIAKDKFQPDYFLYENNWSASKEIKNQIQEELGCPLMRINSALVSAQRRDRFYVFNWSVDQPEDRGILLKDILETGEPYLDKSQCLTSSHCKQSSSPAGVANSLQKNNERWWRNPSVSEPYQEKTDQFQIANNIASTIRKENLPHYAEKAAVWEQRPDCML